MAPQQYLDILLMVMGKEKIIAELVDGVSNISTTKQQLPRMIIAVFLIVVALVKVTQKSTVVIVVMARQKTKSCASTQKIK